MPTRISLAAGLAACALGLAGAAGPEAAIAAQDATPVATPTATGLEVPLKDRAGRELGTATFTEGADGFSVVVELIGLRPGEHGVHLHEAGICDPRAEEAFSNAGGHWNPDDSEHGAPDADSSHAGDFGNLTADDDGTARFEITSDRFTLGAGDEPSVFDEDGTAIIVHANPDDLTSQPGGESGPRVACGVVAAAMEEAAATPVA
jgi:Cu-Zn family superoxide dismutase